MSDRLHHHPAADLFPAMPEDQFAQLRADIEQRGLLEAIVVDVDGLVLDGRHRARACHELGLTPRTTTYKGAEPIGYVVARNLHRRHLDAGQRAMLGLDLLPHLEQEATARRRRQLKQFVPGGEMTEAACAGDGLAPGEAVVPAGTAAAAAATLVNSSERSVYDALRLAKEAPDLGERVRAGELTLNAALRELRARNFERIKARDPVTSADHATPVSHGADEEFFREHEHAAAQAGRAKDDLAMLYTLEGCTDRQAWVFVRARGWNPDGTEAEAWRMADLAKFMGVTKESVRAHYMAALVRYLTSVICVLTSAEPQWLDKATAKRLQKKASRG